MLAGQSSAHFALEVGVNERCTLAFAYSISCTTTQGHEHEHEHDRYALRAVETHLALTTSEAVMPCTRSDGNLGSHKTCLGERNEEGNTNGEERKGFRGSKSLHKVKEKLIHGSGQEPYHGATR